MLPWTILSRIIARNKIENRARVSVAIASRVLNSPGVVALDTRNHVEEAISELKFVPSAALGAINRGHTGTVAALLPTLDNAIYVRVVNGPEERLASEQLSLVVAQTSDDPEIELERAPNGQYRCRGFDSGWNHPH